MKKVNDVSTRAISGFNYSLPLVWNCMIELKPPTERTFFSSCPFSYGSLIGPLIPSQSFRNDGQMDRPYFIGPLWPWPRAWQSRYYILFPVGYQIFTIGGTIILLYSIIMLYIYSTPTNIKQYVIYSDPTLLAHSRDSGKIIKLPVVSDITCFKKEI